MKDTAFLVVLATAGTLLAGCGGAQTTDTAKPGGTPAPAQPAPQPAAPVAQSTPSAPPAAGAPFNAEAEYDKGAALAVGGKFPEARAVFEASAKQDPGDGALAVGVAMLRDLDGGRVSGDVIQRIFRALQQANDQRWKEAHDDVNEALRQAPQYARAHDTKATLYTFQGQYANAIEALDQALKLDPQ